jgi:hypothetical protein
MQTAQASTRVDPEGSIIAPPALARIVLYMYETFAESALLIGSRVLSIACHLHRNRSANSNLHPSILKEALLGHRGWPEERSACIKASPKAPY